MYNCRKTLQIVSIFAGRALRPFPLRCGSANIPGDGDQARTEHLYAYQVASALSPRVFAKPCPRREGRRNPQADIPAVDSQRHKRRAGPLQSGERLCNHVRLAEGDRPKGILRR